MKKVLKYIILSVVVLFIVWIVGTIKTGTNEVKTIEDIPAPIGYSRVPVEKGSFSEYIRNLEVSEGDLFKEGVPYCFIHLPHGQYVETDTLWARNLALSLRTSYLRESKKLSEVDDTFDTIPIAPSDLSIGDLLVEDNIVYGIVVDAVACVFNSTKKQYLVACASPGMDNHQFFMIYDHRQTKGFFQTVLSPAPFVEIPSDENSFEITLTYLRWDDVKFYKMRL